MICNSLSGQDLSDSQRKENRGLVQQTAVISVSCWLSFVQQSRSAWGCRDGEMQGGEAAPSCSRWDGCARAHSWAANHCQAGSCSFRCALIQRDLRCAICTCCLFGGKALSRESALLVLRDVGRSQTFVLLGIQYFDGVLCIWFCAFGKLQFHRKWTIHLHSKIKALNMFQVHRLLPTCHAIPIAGHQRCHVGPDILKRKKTTHSTILPILLRYKSMSAMMVSAAFETHCTLAPPREMVSVQVQKEIKLSQSKVPPQCCGHCWRRGC